jgi:hypothetical protein
LLEGEMLGPPGAAATPSPTSPIASNLLRPDRLVLTAPVAAQLCWVEIRVPNCGLGLNSCGVAHPVATDAGGWLTIDG